MKAGLLLKEVVSVVLAAGFVVLLSVPLGPLPPLGGLLNPNGGIWTVAGSATFPAHQELSMAGLDGDVTVLRDTYGVPHVFATTNRDLFFALGYVHAQDRLWQMDVQYRLAAGRLAEILGPSSVESDAFMRTIGLARNAERFVANLTAGDIERAALEAYKAGVNTRIAGLAFADLPLEYRLLDYRPEAWTPAKSVAMGALIAYGLSASFDDVELGLLQDHLGTSAVDELFPAVSPLQVPIVPNGTRGGGPVVGPEAARDVLAKARLVEPFLGPLRSLGSNNWVVAANRSETQRPMLAGDPHLMFQLPAIWYEVHLCGGDYDAYGVSFPGVPGILIGFNRYIANSETNTGADVTDFYRETVNATDPGTYLFRGQWVAFNVTRETIRVRGGADVAVDVKESVHGPLVTERGESLAMRWTGRDFGHELEAVLLWMKARNWTEFRDALRQWNNPAQNFAFASWDGTTGTIAIRSNGLVPIRNNTQGRVPLDGASGDYEWTGWVPFDEYPQAVDPAQGFLASSNQPPAGPRYPHYLGWTWDPGYRARRINELLNSTIARNGSVRFSEMQAFQLDITELAAAAIVPYLLDATEMRCAMPGPGDFCAARGALAAWDFRMATNSTAATIWHEFYFDYLEGTFGDEWAAANVSDLMLPYPNVLENLTRNAPYSPWFDDVRTYQVETRSATLNRALDRAVTDLGGSYGPLGPAWEWGRVHARYFPHLTELSVLARGPYPSEGDEVTLNPAAGLLAEAGPSWRMVVDLGRPENSVTVYPGGQSGHPLSPHYDDLLRLWLKGEYMAIDFPSTPQLPPSRLESTLILRRA